MANRFLSNIRINDAYTFPASDGTNGQVISTDGAGNLSFIDQASGGGEPLIYLDSFTGTGSQTSFTLSKVVDDEIKTFVYIDGVYQEKDTYEIVSSTLTFSTAPELNHSIEVVIFLSAGIANINQVLYFYGKASESISKGDGVMFAGVQGDHFLFAKATQAAIDANHEYFIGLAAQDLNTNDFGYVTEFGRIDGLNTDIYNEGDTLWFDSGGTVAGALTSTEPVAPLAKIQVAAVLRKHQQQGTLFVRPTWYHELGELHDVNVTSVTDKDMLVWNNASGYWENTKVLGDITTGNITTSGTIDGVDISDFKSSYDAHTHDDRYYTETEIDTFLTNSTNWDTAYSWGDHSLVGYLTSFTETDPVFVASPAYGITSTNITNWNTAYGWGDHSAAGYLTSFTETDPIYVASSWYTTTNNAANWDTAYSWGNHATQSYATQTYVNTAVANLVDTAPTTLDTLNELAAALGDDPNFATTVSGQIGLKLDTSTWTASAASGITSTQVSNWNTAYGWGNHASAGYITTVPAPLTSFSTSAWAGGGGYPGYTFVGSNSRFGFSSTTGVVDIYADGNFYATDSSHRVWHAGDFSSTNVSNWNTAYGWGNHASAGYQSASTAITTSNIGSQSVNFATTAGSANAVSWGNVSGKPAGWLDTTNLIQANAPNTSIPSGFYESYLGDGNPTGTWFNYINVRHNNPANGHGYQLGMSYYDNNLWFRSYQGGIPSTYQSWESALSSGVNHQTKSGILQSDSSLRSPIFYDSNNTGYYVDPASTSYLSNVTTEKLHFPYREWDFSWGSHGAQNGIGSMSITLWDNYTQSGAPSSYGTVLDIYGLSGHQHDQLYFAQGTIRHRYGWYGNNNWSSWFDVYTSNNGSMQTPILYDSNNTGYYVDPNGSSVLAGSLTVSNNNATGGGIILADDGDIVDLNDAYCSMRFSSGVRVFSANRGGSAVHTLHSNGTFTASGDVVAYSDARVKENIEPITNALEKTLSLKGVYYNRTDKEDKSKKIGVIAQEIIEVLPEVVTEDDQGMLGVSYGNITALLIEAIKELSNKVEELENKLNGTD